MPDLTQKPCLVQTGQGFSLSYQNRLLYSKYAPQKAIVQTVERLPLLPHTLILCVSPCLWHGLPELLAKLPTHCFVLGIEADEHLHEVAATSLQNLLAQRQTGNGAPPPVALLRTDEIMDIVEIISTGKGRAASLPPLHSFRRAIMLEMSGGTAFHADDYRRIARAAQDTIAAFWKNRATLTKLGRLFSRNLFRNLAALPRSVPLAAYHKTVERPIVVFGAGESAGQTIAAMPCGTWRSCFVLAVDAALPVLVASGITPHAIVAVESQLAIEKAYIGCTKTNATIFADMSSRQQVTAHTTGAVCYIASRFADTRFLADLRARGLLPPDVPALGSVGLTATYLALNLRATSDVPVYVTGLDFSFSPGATHTRGAPAHTARLAAANRLMPAAHYNAAFRTGAGFAQGKNGAVCTDRALSGYAQQFAGFFGGTKNLFDLGASGLPLGIARADGIADTPPSPYIYRKNELSFGDDLQQHTDAFFAQEIAALERLKDLLTHGERAASPGTTAREEIAQMLARREYLYLHFPDGYQCNADDLSFLKRVRGEIDVFLKDLRLAAAR